MSSKKKKVAIIGAGYTGITIAKELCSKYDVDLIDGNSFIGGMTATFDAYGTKLEYFYRHIFKSDKYAIDLIKELGLDNMMDYNVTRMGYYVKDKGSYDFGTPISLLKFKPLGLWSKIRFGLGFIKIKLIRNYHKLENITADEWLSKNLNKKSYECIFKPLLISKFGEAYKDISMVWLWNKLVARNSSSKANGEALGYLRGSYQQLTDRLEEYLKDKKVNIILNKKISKIVKTRNGKYKLDGLSNTYDKVVITTSLPTCKYLLGDLKISRNYLNKLNAVDYTAAKVLVMFLKESFMPYYWLNIGDSDIPFGGLIEHTNMQDKKLYGNNHVLYVSNYMYKDNPLYKMNKEELFKEYIPYLKKINPNFNKSWVKRLEVYNEDYAQQIVKTNYHKHIPDTKIPHEELYVASMAMIYPEDRGMNNAIGLGVKTAKLIIDKDK